MVENKGQTIFLSVIGIATLLVAIIGATFAYFTATMSGEAANVGATTATIGGIAFEAEGFTANVPTIYPGWTSGEKAVTVTADPTEATFAYTCSLVLDTVSANLSDLQLMVTGPTGKVNDAYATFAAINEAGTYYLTNNGSTGVNIGPNAGPNAVADEYTYTVKFAETGTNQNTQQNGTFTGTVKCALTSGTVYYNQANQTGTTVTPTAY